MQDAQGREVERYDYDAQGRVAGITDAGGQRSAMEYDAYGELARLIEPGQVVTDFLDDGSLVDPNGHFTDSGVDDFGNVVYVDSPDSGLSQYRFDEADNLIEEITALGQSIAYRYDAAGRLIEKTRPDGTATLSYTHGQLTEVVDSASTERYAYDDYQRLTEQTRILDGHVFTTRYDYDPASGRCASTKTAN